MKGKNAQSKGAKGGKGKKVGEGAGKNRVDPKSLKEESEAERAKAAAALWEARLEVTEISRKEHREAARRLARNNEELERQRRRLEKDMVDVVSCLKKQDAEKEDQIEKLKQQVNELKLRAKEESEQAAEQFAKQLEEMEEKFHRKAKEIGLIQIELKMIKEFRKKKTLLEKELEDLKDTLDITKKEHQETISMLEKKFIEEKQRLEREAEKKIIMLAERAHHEAIATNIQKGKVDISELTWEQKERVLRLLFAKMNGLRHRKYSQVLVPVTPTNFNFAETKASEDDAVPIYAFITQQAPLSESSHKSSPLPDIHLIPPEISMDTNHRPLKL